MLRAVWLTIGKEFLLIRRDRVGLFMLLVAPIAVIAAAGFSLAKIYGGRTRTARRICGDHFRRRPWRNRARDSRRARQSARPGRHSIFEPPRRRADRSRAKIGGGWNSHSGRNYRCDRARPRRAAHSLHRSGQVPADHQGRVGAFGVVQKNQRRRCRRCAQSNRRTHARLYPQARPGARVRRSKPAPKPLAWRRRPTRRAPAVAPRIREHIETALTTAREQTRLALNTELDRIQRKIDADSRRAADETRRTQGLFEPSRNRARPVRELVRRN